MRSHGHDEWKNIDANLYRAKITNIPSQDGPFIIQNIPSLQATVWHLTHVHDHLSLHFELGTNLGPREVVLLLSSSTNQNAIR